ncbi:MAG: hypothetical protein WC758_05950 [Candidatus Woesearchaeota archaeon]|jgi:hypothetical protein
MHKTKKILLISSITIILILIIISSIIIYNKKTSELFDQKYNKMNANYKEVLFSSGQEGNNTTELMNEYEESFLIFYKSYATKPIVPYSKDLKWKQSLDSMNSSIYEAKLLIESNKFIDAHYELENIRKEWQVVFQRNNVTMLGFYLTEYHDVMEIAIDEADAEKYDELEITCDKLLMLWQNVDSIKVQFSSDDLLDFEEKKKANSINLQELCSATKNLDIIVIKDKASNLKRLFVSLYLKYG